MILLTQALPIPAWHLLSHHETLFRISKATTWFYTYYGRFMSKTFYGSSDRHTSSFTGKKCAVFVAISFGFVLCLDFAVLQLLHSTAADAAVVVGCIVVIESDPNPWNIMHRENIEILIFNYGTHFRCTLFQWNCVQKWISSERCKLQTHSRFFESEIFISHKCQEATNRMKDLKIAHMQ